MKRQTPREPEENQNRINGTISGVVYHNAANGYSVLRVTGPDGREFTAVGQIPDAAEGEMIQAEGEWTEHAEYGRQFRMTSCEKKLPTSADAIFRYLASGAVAGVGTKTALKIVGKFGNDTFEVMDKHPAWLSQIPGISPKKAQKIGESFAERAGMRSLLMLCGDALSPAAAMNIYRRWGSAAPRLIEQNPYRIAEEFDGIGFEKADRLAAAIGFSGDPAFRVRCGILHTLTLASARGGHCCLPEEELAEEASRLLGAPKSEIFARIAEEFDGIGFEKADRLAAAIGFAGDPAFRVRCGILHTLTLAAARGGHCCLPEEELAEEASRLLGAPKSEILARIADLIREGAIVISSGKMLYKESVWRTECEVAKRLFALDRACAKVGVENVQTLISVVEAENGITYAGRQREAIVSAVESGVSVITGGPGTGKTTVIRALIRIFEGMGLECALAAPTGRAAKRMSEATSHEAGTVHRLLEMDIPAEGREEAVFLRDQASPLEARVIIIDEASMLDLFLTAALLRAIRPGSRLVLIGDSDQLPSVGAGNVLRDIIASAAFPTVRLTEIFRQAEKSLIVRAAHAVNRGEMPDLTSRDEDFFFLRRADTAATAATVVSLCAERLPRAFGEEGRTGVQVITPSKRGAAGTESLNVALRAALNPPAPGREEREVGGRLFRVGDKVMQTKNNYDLTWRRMGGEGRGVFNGDIGVIRSLSRHDGCAEIAFDDRVVSYDYAAFEDLDLAYAVTVHKSQGSEYPIVVMPVYPCAPLLLTRNMLYTALTRGKDRVILVGSPDVLKIMVENDRQAVRYSGLRERIADERIR